MSHTSKDLDAVSPDDAVKGEPKTHVAGKPDSKGRPVDAHTQDCGAEGPKG